MADIQRVSCNTMKRDAEALEAVLKKLPKEIERMQASMRNLAHCWEGPAWQVYQHQVNEDIQNMTEVYKNLAELQKKLGKGRDIYLRTEHDVYTDLKSLWI